MSDRTQSRGVLPSQALEKLVAQGQIRARTPVVADQIQPSSIDLRLGHEAHRVRASFLAKSPATISSKLEEYRLHTLNLEHSAVFEKGCVYIVPLLEELALPEGISGKANPKSSTGRLDIFTRLITDEGRQFEMVPSGYHGRLFAEVVPQTFSVVVRQGERLSQLRLFEGEGPEHRRSEEEVSQDLRLSVDLAGINGSNIIGYRARKHAPLIDLAKLQHYDPEEFWDPIRRNSTGSLILDPDDFYILASREKVRIPAQYAAEMVPFDATIGELRTHYAGFFDPGFGCGANGGDGEGTRAVLEVRSHEVPFVMEDGQIVASLFFEKLTELPKLLYGEGIGSSYQRQGLKLSKHFRAPSPS